MEKVKVPQSICLIFKLFRLFRLGGHLIMAYFYLEETDKWLTARLTVKFPFGDEKCEKWWKGMAVKSSSVNHSE